MKNKKTKKLNLKDYLLILGFFLFILYGIRLKLIYYPILNNFHTEKTKGIIIDKKNYISNGRSHLTSSFTYSYEFYLNGDKLENNSYGYYKVGDTVLVEYNKIFPFINRLVKTK